MLPTGPSKWNSEFQVFMTKDPVSQGYYCSYDKHQYFRDKGISFDDLMAQRRNLISDVCGQLSGSQLSTYNEKTEPKRPRDFVGSFKYMIHMDHNLESKFCNFPYSPVPTEWTRVSNFYGEILSLKENAHLIANWWFSWFRCKNPKAGSTSWAAIINQLYDRESNVHREGVEY